MTSIVWDTCTNVVECDQKLINVCARIRIGYFTKRFCIMRIKLLAVFINKKPVTTKYSQIQYPLFGLKSRAQLDTKLDNSSNGIQQSFVHKTVKENIIKPLQQLFSQVIKNFS